MLKKVISLFLVVVFVTTSLVFTGTAFGNSIIDGNTAKAIASNHIKVSAVESLQDWKSAIPSDAVPLYDLKGNIDAFGFNVLKDKNVVGYIIVDTDRNDAPVPEFGVGGPLPFLTTSTDQIQQKLKQKINLNQSLGKAKFIYPSALTYLVEYPVSDDQGRNTSLIVDLRDGELINDKADTASSSADTVNMDKNSQAWARLENSNVTLQPMNLVVERIISGVPSYNWRKGCSPTSGAMVMAYWAMGYYNQLPVGNTLIDELSIQMQTQQPGGGTSIGNIPLGIDQEALNHGYPLWAAYNDNLGRAYSTYSKYTNEIYAGRPILATLIGSSTYSDHTMAGVGYRYDDYQNWIIVHDTWDTSSNKYLDYNSSVINTPLWTYVLPS